MVIETYEIQEVEEAKVEDLEQCAALVDELGLTGQNQYYRPNERDGEQGIDVFPYRKMTAQEKVVIKALCPEVTKLESYKDGPIPLRVMQVAAHAKALRSDIGDECGLYVWHPRSADDPDPYLCLQLGPYYSPRETYILARWGDELDNWNTMIEKAKAIMVAERINLLETIVAKVEAMKGSVVSYVNHAVLTGTTKIPTFYE